MHTNFKLCLYFLVALAAVEGHVRLLDPTARSSLWRYPQFAAQNPVINYDDDGLYCGRVHQQEVVTDCGICGDPWVDPIPRANENGGIYGQGIIARTYSAGQSVVITVEYTTSHLGYFEIQLCNGLPETESCFLQNVLTFTETNSTKYEITQDGGAFTMSTSVKLPDNLTCEHCILRLNYRAGNNWGECNPPPDGMGCGLQETFRHCSDIVIR